MTDGSFFLIVHDDGDYCGRCGLRLDDPHRIANRKLANPDDDGTHTAAECDDERLLIDPPPKVRPTPYTMSF